MARSIILRGAHARDVWRDIARLADLLHGRSDLSAQSSDEVSPETKALVVTFLQQALFGQSSRHDDKYGSKLDRNRTLVDIDAKILRLRMSGTESFRVILRDGRTKIGEVDLGHIFGATVLYPLNEYAKEEYASGGLAPHEFDRRHLVHASLPEEPTHAVFIGGALSPVWLVDMKRLRGKDPDQVDVAPLFAEIAAGTVERFSRRMWPEETPAGLALAVEDDGPCPCVYTSFSRKGVGEDFARSVGLRRDKRVPVDPKSDDIRYELDLNDLEDVATTSADRERLLRGWAAFLQFSTNQSALQLAALIDQSIMRLPYEGLRHEQDRR